MDEMYDKAKVEKLKELQKLLRDILANEGDAPMEDGKMDDALEEAGESADEESAEGNDIAQDGVDASAAEDPGAMDEVAQMKQDYFKPKPKMSSPDDKKGVAMAIIGPPKGPLDALKMAAKRKR